jgi:hypothetical protein
MTIDLLSYEAEHLPGDSKSQRPDSQTENRAPLAEEKRRRGKNPTLNHKAGLVGDEQNSSLLER